MTPTAWLLLAVIVVQLGLIGAGNYLKSYLAKKGENLATREDLRVLTSAVEEVKAEFASRQEREKHLLARHLEEHRLSLETELPIYRELWDKILALEAALSEVQVAYAMEGDSAQVRGMRDAARTRFEATKEQFYREMNRVKPFIAPEVHLKLFLAFVTVRRVAADSQLVLQSTDPDRHQVISDGISKTSKAFQELSTSIRSRLYPTTPGVEVKVMEGDT